MNQLITCKRTYESNITLMQLLDANNYTLIGGTISLIEQINKAIIILKDGSNNLEFI